MNRTLRLLGATAVAGGLVLAGPALPAHTSALSLPDCATAAGWYDAAPSRYTERGRYWIREAVHCLINAERAAAGLRPLRWNPRLQRAAAGHAYDAVRLKWWGSGLDAHTNPVTGSTPLDRIKRAGYCPGARAWSVAEVTYHGWGGGLATPRSAVYWWMRSPGHRAVILSRSLTEIGVYTVGDVADPGGAGAAVAGAYVANFGRCDR